MTENSPYRLAVLTRRWTWTGEYVLRELARRGVRPSLVLVENTPMRARIAMARRLARRIGWTDAVRYNANFWWPLFKRATGFHRTPRFPYERFADRVVEASDINAPAMARAMAEEKVDRVLLAQSGIVRQPILDLDGIWIINAHPGLLPRMRGVDVIRWSILEDVALGITVHVVDNGVDTGPILGQETVVPMAAEPFADFDRRLNERAAELLVEFGLAGPGAFPAPKQQSREDGRQYYMMPRNLAAAAKRKFDLLTMPDLNG